MTKAVVTGVRHGVFTGGVQEVGKLYPDGVEEVTLNYFNRGLAILRSCSATSWHPKQIVASLQGDLCVFINSYSKFVMEVICVTFCGSQVRRYTSSSTEK